ncbi:MAG: PAS domain S-box protein [Desulfomonile tiedjei]|uniref:histidine kinase n=1 Tax=Desulfomonile tiedjei TaxID=2358 RepID=A0A9D6Z2Y6_9BACT|nr:PAS domain S-box protein [Desulfomonile tiedjei]
MERLKQKWAALSKSLGFRMALSVGFIVLSTYILLIYFVLDIQQDFYFEQMIREAERFSTAVINATNHSMLQDDRETTLGIITNIGKLKEVSDIRIYDHEGMVRFSGRSAEVGSKVDKKAEACFVCHSEDKPFSEAVTDKRTRVYSHDGHRVLGMITPIYNKTSCYTAPCHVHPEDHKILGVLDTGMSLKGFDSHIRSLVLRTVVVAVGTFGAVLFTIILYIAFRVHRPVSQLRDAAMKIAMGEFSEKLHIQTQDQIGECAWAFNIMRDQIRRRTHELVRSREQYKLLFEQVPCFICVIDKNFEIVRQNSYMRALFKGTVGMKCYEVFKKRSGKCEDCHVDVTFRKGEVSGKEHCGLKVTGEEANYLSYTSPIVNDKGEVLYAMLIAVDIGDRVRLQRALQASQDFQTNLIENSIHGIVATDDQGRINIYNIAAENLFGYPAQEVIGDADLEKYFPKQFIEMILAAHLGQKSGADRLVAQETVIAVKQGEPVPVRFSGFILLDKGKTAGAVGFFQDLRTFKQLEREKQASDRLAVVGQTVAGLAHGIKNILTGLEGGIFVLETALEDKDDQLLQRGWKMVQNNIGRISALVKDLLSYSRERAPQYEETDPNLLAEEVCALFDVKAREKSIVIERQFDPDAGRMFKIFLDQRGIHACLSNLVANAMDACEIDTKDVAHRIVVRTEQDMEGNLLFQVSDNGIGMSEATKRKLFASFYSTKGSRGTGLGLMVTSKIVMEHGGQITFDSEEGVGSTFSIVLPSAEFAKNLDHAKRAAKGFA